MSGHPLEAMLLVAATVVIHALGSLVILWGLTNYEPRLKGRFRFVRSLAGLVYLVVALVLLHLTEVSVWASFYVAQGLFDNIKTAVYFSLVTYTTVGYGDVTLPEEWNLLGGCEALAGILMAAWSTAILIPTVNRLHGEAYGEWSRKRLLRESGRDAGRREGGKEGSSP